jgi:hypothetical protein
MLLLLLSAAAKAGAAPPIFRGNDDVAQGGPSRVVGAPEVRQARPQSSMVRSSRRLYIRQHNGFRYTFICPALAAGRVPEPQAEAIADATRELVMEDVASKSDIASVKSDIAGVKADLVALEQRLTAAMETLSLRLTVRMGVMLAAGLSLMTALISLLIRSH